MIILGTNSIKDTGFDVANSLRFNDGSSDYLNRTPSSASNRRTFTFSTWIKRASSSANQMLLVQSSNSSNFSFMRFKSTGTLSITSESGASSQYNLIPDMLFRDFSAWYHIVFAVDTTQGTAANRMKLYVNGSQITDFSTETYPNQNTDTMFNSTNPLELGRRTYATDEFFDGYMAETVFIDGTQNAVTDFGEFDEDSGIWKPIDVSGLTFGTNGFYLDFENSGSLGADVSGNGNNFTVNNLTAIDQVSDSPTLNFCTWNPLNVNDASGRTFSEGNLTVNEADNTNPTSVGSIGVNTGKWYYEIKIDSASGSDSSNGKLGHFGWYNIEATTEALEDNGLFLMADSRVRGQGTTAGSSSSAIFSVGDIVQCALDLDNGNCYFGKGGNWYNGSGSFNQTFANSTAVFTSITTNNMWTAGRSKGSTANNVTTLSANFGNPPYAISSGNTDGDGYGNFEYAVPSGYYSLNTKNLAEYG